MDLVNSTQEPTTPMKMKLIEPMKRVSKSRIRRPVKIRDPSVGLFNKFQQTKPVN